MRSIAQRDPAVNSALLAANERLLALRQQHKSKRDSAGKAPTATAAVSLPQHLGWGGPQLTRLLRRQAERPPAAAPITLAIELEPQAEPQQTTQVRLYPSLAAAMLRSASAAAGRVWLLCRHIDSAGRGWLTIDQLRQQLTKRESPLRICGWRRLRQLLQLGSGRYWRHDDQGRLWLFSAEQLARNLDVERLSGRPVWLPLAQLLGGMQALRANLYAAIHSGRDAQPISRQVVQQISGVPARTQRHYDQISGQRKEACFVVAGPSSKSELQARCYQHGSAFEFIDKQGRQGPAGQRYVAWRLPNRYHPLHERCARGRQRKINRNLRSDLVNQRAQGNGQQRWRRIFFDGQRIEPAAEGERYWYSSASGVWHVAVHPSSIDGQVGLRTAAAAAVERTLAEQVNDEPEISCRYS